MVGRIFGMAQVTFGDDDLFAEASDDVRGDVEDHLDAARDALPDPDGVWEATADNALGVLNGLRSSLDAGDAADHLRSAKKWYTLAERADAIDDEELADEITRLESLVEEIDTTRDAVGDLAATLPEIRSDLQDLADDPEPTPNAEPAADASVGTADA